MLPGELRELQKLWKETNKHLKSIAESLKGLKEDGIG